jgi:hypothetical protein
MFHLILYKQLVLMAAATWAAFMRSTDLLVIERAVESTYDRYDYHNIWHAKAQDREDQKVRYDALVIQEGRAIELRRSNGLIT